jgi:hypothetical protein
MSGGYIKPQKPGDHQVVIFTFVGKIDRNSADKWNQALLEFKQLFGPGLTAVTITGNPTPTAFARRGRKSRKK